MGRKNIYVRIVAVVALAAIMAACASIGRPEGGPRDENPPVFVRSEPAVGSLNFDGSKIIIDFDENIQVKDAMDKVVVSPAQKTNPSVSANGRRLVVEFRDTLVKDATYTVDFSDAISDLNESNPLEGFAIDFSTGSTLDSLCISGMVFEARNLEPAQGMLVGVYSNLSDTALTTLPFERIAKTNHLGQFTVRNLKPGTYRLYAVNDKNRDLHWDRSEDVAFLDTVITPWTEPTVVNDTLAAADGSDSIVPRNATLFMPNDVLLTWFNEDYKAQYLKDYRRPERNRIAIDFAAPSDTLPELTIVNGSLAGTRLDRVAVLNCGATRDTLDYWLRPDTLLKQDTILIAARFLRTDTLDRLSWGTDTLKFTFKEPKKKKEKKKKKKDEEADTLPEDTVPPIVFLDFNPVTSKNHDVYMPAVFRAGQPIDTIFQSGVHLAIKNDTLWDTIPAPPLVRQMESRPMTYKMDYKWEYGATYCVTVDSATVYGLYGNWNKPFRHEFTVKKEEEYSNLFFNVSGIDDSLPVVVELLSSSDEPVGRKPVVDHVAEFYNLASGTYYARAFVDTNGNGLWDTGNVKDKRQPEDVYYYPKKIKAKKNWDIEQSWDLNAQPLDMQKPLDIKKNKPKRKRGEKPAKRDSDDEEEEDEWGESDNTFGPGSGWQGGSAGGAFRTNGGSSFR